jgi:hypothetical protein
MARKNVPAARAKKKPTPRIARPDPAKPRLAAHARLIHGFLVRLARRSTIHSPDTRSASIGATSVKARLQDLSDAKHEGPADDATFH